MNIAILGAGISGLSIAQMLKKEHNIFLFELQSQIGGLIKCEWVQDCLFHKVGGHVFNTKNKTVSDWFWSFFDKDKEFLKAKRKAKILFNNNIIGYPIENYLYLLSSHEIRNIFAELIALQKNKNKSPFEYDNFEQFLKGNFGNTLYHMYFEPYNKKIWNTDLDAIPMEWLDGKLPMPDFNEIVLTNIIREEEEKMVHSSFFYPKDEGSQFIINRLSENLDIEKSFNPDSLKIESQKIIITNKIFDKVIYTGNVKHMPKSIVTLLDNDIKIQLTNLRANGTSNLFCETDELDISWLYIPQNFTKAHRIIYTGNFSASNNRGSKRKTCVVEFSGKVSLEEMENEIKKLPGNLIPISYNYEEYSYVVQDNNTRNLIRKTKKILEPHNIFLLGRFAEWEYYNMDKAIEASMNLASKI
jgi:protoporphyrinogen oxidase